jgi:hypothetical protein
MVHEGVSTTIDPGKGRAEEALPGVIEVSPSPIVLAQFLLRAACSLS